MTCVLLGQVSTLTQLYEASRQGSVVPALPAQGGKQARLLEGEAGQAALTFTTCVLPHGQPGSSERQLRFQTHDHC